MKKVFIVNVIIHFVIITYSVVISNVINYTLSGVVMDNNTKKVLADAQITIVGESRGTLTDEKGRFTISGQFLDEDSLKVSFIGYKTIVHDIKAETKYLTFYLEPKVIVMPEIGVEADRFNEERFILKTEPSPRFFTSGDINKFYSAFTPDLDKMLLTIPGATTTNELSSHLNIRGGNFDQNLVMLDGAVIYYPYHYLGLISGFNKDMISDITLSMGGFSARYGDRLGAVTSIHTIRPKKSTPTRIHVGLIGADITTGGKMGGKLGYLFSARTSYYDLIGRIIDNSFPFYFYDLFGKIEYNINNNHNISLFGYYNMDKQSIINKNQGFIYSSTDSDKQKIELVNEDRISLHNQVFSINWDFFISKILKTNLQISSSSYKNFFVKQKYANYPSGLDEKYAESKNIVEEDISKENSESSAIINNLLQDANVRYRFVLQKIPDLHIEGGLEYHYITFDYGWNGMYKFWDPFVNLFFDYSPEDYFDFKQTAASFSGYVEFLWDISERYHLRTGMRTTTWSFVDKIYPEPRINLSINLSQNMALKFAYGKFTQGISTSLERGLIGFLELYFPNQYGANIERAEHYITTFSLQNLYDLNFQISAYYKPFENLLMAIDSIPGFAQSRGTAYGFEAEASGNVWGLETQISYVWSHSLREYKETTFDVNFDQRHRVQLSLMREFGKGWTISSYWLFHSGQPYDPGRYLALYRGVDESFYYNYRSYNVFGAYETDAPRGRIRYPCYHRLDLNIAKIFKRGSVTYTPYISIRNAYSRENVLYYRNIEYQPLFENKHWVNPDLDREPFFIPIIPSIGLRIKF